MHVLKDAGDENAFRDRASRLANPQLQAGAFADTHRQPMKPTTCFFLLLPTLGILQADAATELFRDASQPLEKRVGDLVSRLTVEEKGQFLNHKGSTIERFNIRSDQWNQGPKIRAKGEHPPFPRPSGRPPDLSTAFTGKAIS